ncbi:PCP reductase family protein [Oceanicoccus sp. KOV_DT_Chl]|uniref:PCP reductase family protein n=1 Tax=Oceanicoccus sp. KOV_DT_Chl TaxID=1904639 RepID=UPI000C7A7382|nr:PCP reductase family protein [Oceanicoccus sp. KOV_DT_Chl]
MDWDLEALETIAKAPKFVRKFAVSNVEDFAEDNNHTRISVEVVQAQADSAGMGKFLQQAEQSTLGKWIAKLKK